MATCPICEMTIPIIPDSQLRYCKCKALGVDCASNIEGDTRFLGIMSTEDPHFAGWWAQYADKCLEYRKWLQSKNLL